MIVKKLEKKLNMILRLLASNFFLMVFVATAISQEVFIFTVKPYSWSQTVSEVVIAKKIVQDRTQYYQLLLPNGQPMQLSKDKIVGDITLPVTKYNPLTFISLEDWEMESLESLISQVPTSTGKNILINALNGVRQRKLLVASTANEEKKSKGSIGPIVSKTGKTYSDVESWSFDKGHLKISHRDGVARIPFNQILEGDYKILGITFEKAERLEAELMEFNIQQQALEQEKQKTRKSQRDENLVCEKKIEIEKQLGVSNGSVFLDDFDENFLKARFNFPWIIDDKIIQDTGTMIVSKSNSDFISIEIKNNIGLENPSINNLIKIPVGEISKLIESCKLAAQIDSGFSLLREKKIESKSKQSEFKHFLGEISECELYYLNGSLSILDKKNNAAICISPLTAILLSKICVILKN
jgi:hypothetical protein